MDFHELLNFAASKQENLSKTKNVPKYSLNLPAPKKEEKSKPKSAVIQSLLKEKEKEREVAERALQEKLEEEKKKNQFKIPKKKADVPLTIDKETLISSLFDDAIDSPIDAPVSSAAGKSSSSIDSAPHKHSSDHVSNGKLRTSDTKHEHSHSKPLLENSCRKHAKHQSDKTDLSSNKSKPHGETTYNKSTHSSSSSKHTHSSSSSKRSHSSSNSKPSHSTSNSKPNHSSSNSKPSHSSTNSRPSSSSSNSKPSSSSHSVSNGVAKSVPSSTLTRESGDQKTSTMTEKEKILARLQAIKQRTLEAIHKENASKGKRVKGERSHRKSKNDDKHDDKAKSAEIVRDDDDSDDEVGVSDVPSALDIMLSDRNAKLEKEKISRLAKQAWERATKAQSDTEEKVKKKSKKSSSSENRSSHHKHKSSHKDKKVHSSSSDINRQKAKVKHKNKIVKSSNAPPPMDFKAILAMAEQKQKAPPKPALSIPKKKKEEEERPLTQEEKDRRERQKSKEYQEWLKRGGQRPGMKEETNGTKPAAAVTKTKAAPSSSQPTPSSKHSLPKPSQSDTNNRVKPKSSVVNENIISLGPEEEEDSEGEERSPLRDSTNPFDKIMQQVHKKRPGLQVNSGIPKKQSRILDSEEEDSDMDSFIDDEDCELDYSKEIQNIFGYNKNNPINTPSKVTFNTQYKDEDEDLSNMDADFKTVMMEEKRSAKLGLMEDLEDMRKEQMEKAMKKKMLKKGK